MAINIDTKEDLVRLVVVMFDAAVGETYLVDLVHAVESGNSIRQIAENLFSTDQAKALYPVSQSDAQFTDQFLQQLCGDYLDAGEYQMAFSEIMGLLGTGSSKGDVVVEAMNYLRYSAPLSSAFDNLKNMQANKFEVAKYHTIELNSGGTYVPDLQSVLDGVTHTDESVQKAKEAIGNSGVLKLLESVELNEIVTFSTDADVINGFAIGTEVSSVSESDTTFPNEGTVEISNESAGIDGGSEIILIGTLTDVEIKGAEYLI